MYSFRSKKIDNGTSKKTNLLNNYFMKKLKFRKPIK